MEDRNRLIRNASWVGIIGNAILSFSKIAVGLISGSLAVLGDGIDSATDIVTSLITLVTAKIMSRPPDMKYPYGYERADTVAAKALSFVIFFAGTQLAISTIQKIFHETAQQLPGALAIYITVFSIIGKLLLSWHQLHEGKKTGSIMLKANARNMQNDVLISIGVLLGLGFTFFLNLPILDAVTALVVSGLIIKAGFDIFMQAGTELMDGVKNPHIYKRVFDIIDKVPGVLNPHRLRMRRLGNMYIMDIDIEVAGNLTVREAHCLSHKVEDKIKEKIDNIYDIVIHIEPEGDINHKEKFGVSPNHCDF